MSGRHPVVVQLLRSSGLFPDAALPAINATNVRRMRDRDGRGWLVPIACVDDVAVYLERVQHRIVVVVDQDELPFVEAVAP